MTPPEVPGVTHLNEDQAVFQRRAVLVITVAPLVGFLVAMVTLWGTGLSLVDLSIMIVTYYFAGLGVTIGFHRLLTHGSFQTKPWMKALLAIAGSFAIQGSVISWVAAHRRHHAFSDKEGDPHSPHLDEGEGMAGILRGLWHAHIGWLFTPELTDLDRWAPDMVKDPVMKKVDRLFPLWVVLSLALPAALGFAITQTLEGAVTAFLWGGLARVFLLHHVTWSINSICHFYGKRPFETTDHSTNNWPLAILSFGESWHNNHHAFPSAARHGILKGQIDTSAGVISLLQKLKLVENVKEPSTKQLAAKKAE
ncbi:MAG: acyl-CoA desaturase [Actinomycetota bacterium]|nr:acyl-CoA desaturase [Actinomycetota bacterium]